MTLKYDNFILALEAICKEHKVMLDTGYDGCAVHDMDTEGWYVGMAFSQNIKPYDETKE